MPTALLRKSKAIGGKPTWRLGLTLLESMLMKIYYLPAKKLQTVNVLTVLFTTSVGGEGLMSKSNIKKYQGIYFHLSKDELAVYHSLTPDQKRIIRTIVKTLIYNPQLLNESSYLFKLLAAKTVSRYVCPLCLMPFSSSVSLKQHIRYTSHPNICPICKKKFQKTNALLDHVCKKHDICVS